MHVVARTRFVLARRPWLYWLAVAGLAALAALTVHGRLTTLDDAEHAWGDTHTVLVATHALEPGDLIDVRSVDLPLAAVPSDALDQLPADARLLQRVAEGEVVTALDVTAQRGPAAGARPGTIVVGLTDPLSRSVTIGLSVRVVADGLVLAANGTVVEVVDDVTFVAVDPADAPAIAAAAQQGLASLLYVP